MTLVFSVCNLIEDLDQFSSLSGLVPCYVSLKNTLFTLPCSLPIKWADGEVDILGIHISKKYKLTYHISFQ